MNDNTSIDAPQGVKLWIAGARPRTLPAAIVPIVVGGACAVEAENQVWWRLALALVVSLALQVGVNYANDYSDGIKGTDEKRVNPLRLVGSGLASPSSVKRAATPLSELLELLDWCSLQPQRGGCCWWGR